MIKEPEKKENNCRPHVILYVMEKHMQKKRTKTNFTLKKNQKHLNAECSTNNIRS